MVQKAPTLPDVEKSGIFCLIVSALEVAWLSSSHFLSYFWLFVFAAVDSRPLGPIHSPEFYVSTEVFVICIALWMVLCFTGADKGIASNHMWRSA